MEFFQVQFSTEDLLVIAPEVVLTGFALLILLISAFARGERRGFLGYTALLGAMGALASMYWVMGREASAFSGMVSLDPFSFFFKVMIGIITLLTILASLAYAKREGIDFGEYYVLVLFATVGMMLMASGANLLIIFLGLEVMSISIYVLAGIMRDDARSVEAASLFSSQGSPCSSWGLDSK